MAYIYQCFYDKWWFILSRFMWQVMAYTYEDLYDKWCLIYIKIYMTSDGLYMSQDL